MNNSYLISCSSPVDVDFDYFNKRGAEVLFFTYLMDEKEHEDIMGRDKEKLHQFYEDLTNGKRSFTSQVPVARYVEYFERLLKTNKTIIHIELGTGMTNTIVNALKAVEIIKKEHKDCRIDVIDSLCSSSGYGLLVDTALDMKDEGKSIDEVENWIIDNRNKIHHQFFCTDLKYFKRSGRITMMTAIFGGIMKVCPIMHLNKDGKIIVYNKAFGRKNAIKKTIEETLEHIENKENYQGKLWISHSDSPLLAEKIKDQLATTLPKAQIKIWDIGTIIGSHCGPGTVALYFMGDERGE